MNKKVEGKKDKMNNNIKYETEDFKLGFSIALAEVEKIIDRCDLCYSCSKEINYELQKLMGEGK